MIFIYVFLHNAFFLSVVYWLNCPEQWRVRTLMVASDHLRLKNKQNHVPDYFCYLLPYLQSLRLELFCLSRASVAIQWIEIITIISSRNLWHAFRFTLSLSFPKSVISLTNTKFTQACPCFLSCFRWVLLKSLSWARILRRFLPLFRWVDSSLVQHGSLSCWYAQMQTESSAPIALENSL